MANFIDTFFSKIPKTKSRDQLVGEFYASLDANTSAKRDPQTSGISRQIAHIKNMGLGSHSRSQECPMTTTRGWCETARAYPCPVVRCSQVR